VAVVDGAQRQLQTRTHHFGVYCVRRDAAGLDTMQIKGRGRTPQWREICGALAEKLAMFEK
jgi:hypothetical protein